MASSRKITVALLAIIMLLSYNFSEAQDCVNDLENLAACTTAIGGNGTVSTPSNQCCTALKSTSSDCICNAVRTVTALPSKCGLPSITCPGNSLPK
ncbi:hypothetical protein SUGI_0704920 [Cryptomeria japonica]|uniref:male-cone protein 1 n=1 Tax=Cryptomeria japonica TaxID=3369 RepID=UPI0024147EF3|nr:male-cone protein 1 [Cryptomeria japonica]GLJ35024.1 hypothetical protein SUGI_0704920 [Cryptomeria japonica]